MSAARYATLVALALSCGPYEDTTPLIAVDPNAAKRAAVLLGGAHLPVADAGVPAPAARVHVMKAGEELGGPNAIGRPGDLILENDEVVFVIDQLGRNSSAGFAETGGNLVDAADARDRRDELGQMFTYFGVFPRQAVYESLESGVAADGSAFVAAQGHELYESRLAVRTRYTLHAGDRAVLIETQLANQGDHPILLLGLGDAIQWGGAEHFAPDRGRGFSGVSKGAYLGAVGRLTSYAISATDGDVAAESGPTWSDTEQLGRTTLAPGEKLQYARVFLVGPRPDVAGLVAELTRAAGGAVGALRVDLTGASGPVTPSDDADVEIDDASGRPVMELRARDQKIEGEVPPGRYQLRYAHGGGRAPKGAAVPIEVRPNETSSAKLEVTEPARFRAECKERPTASAGSPPTATAVPCKVTFEGVSPTPAPEFGPAHAAGPARNQVTTADGKVDVPLAPGRYKVTLSRGPEYALAEIDVDLRAGETADPCGAAPEKCVLRRVVDTSGYLAGDFHQHTMLGIDAPTGTRERIVANVTEGVELAVSSEHNVVADLEPLVRQMGLERYLVEITGEEITTDASRQPWGHANAFPLVARPELPRGGSVAVRDRTAKEIFAELRAQYPDMVLQINHPRAGRTGYFDQYDFDRKRGIGADPGYDARFDAIEVWNGRNVVARNAVLIDVLSLLANGHPVTLTGNTDTHGVVGQECGYPRTYVRVKSDGALDAWDETRTADLVRALREVRDVVVTNGPFLKVSAAGGGIGSVVRPRAGHLKVDVTVESAPWVEVKRVAIVRARGPQNGTEKLEVNVTPRLMAGGSMRASVQLDLAVDRDDAFIVTASGDRPLQPVLAGHSSELLPYALAGVIWVDADGDGRALGR